MHSKRLLNQGWQFHAGEIGEPFRTAKKAHALGGLTSNLPAEGGQRLPLAAGGNHFLKLIAQGNVAQGLRNLAGTDLDSQLTDDWHSVDLPHDWKVAQPYVNDPANLMSGSKADGVGYYRRTFELTSDLYKTNRVILHFDGIMRMADIWLNGAYLAHNNSGYTTIDLDITEMANYGAEGPNVVLVRADTTTGPEGWWYEGAGIYKSVWLETTPLVTIDPDDCYLYTQKLTTARADMVVECQISNHSDKTATVTPQVKIGTQVVEFGAGKIAAHAQQTFKTATTLDEPQLWTPEQPYLNKAAFSIDSDQVTKQFGIHTFAYTPAGFFLNGQPYELRGVCEHQDFAGVGTALDQDIVDFKVSQMKKMGVNAWRSAHHFASEELLNACDRLGMLIIDENRLLESSPWRIQDLTRMVKKSRQHASIAFWSVANEELIGNTPLGGRIAKRLVQTIKQLDHEHLVISAELLNPAGEVDSDYLKNYDVLGVNYPEAGVMGAGAAIIKQEHPELPLMSTENASYFSTRGAYRDDAEHCQTNNFGSMYSMVMPGKRQPGDPGVGGTAHPEEVLAYAKQHPYMGGVFLWTAFDYFGEPSPFGWPGIGSQFGIADNCGFPKDYYYYYQAHWTSQPMVHVMPTWNADALAIDADGKVAVRAFSNTEALELFVNGHSLGRQAVEDCQANWQVPYQAGTLSVKAYAHDELVAETQQVTSEVIAKVTTRVVYQGKQDTLYEITGVDQQDRFVPTADNLAQLQVTNGKIIGVGNGDPANTKLPEPNQVSLFNGKALVIVRQQNEQVELTSSLLE